MSRIYKTVVQENGSITIHGSNRWIRIDYAIPEWENGKQLHPYFRYRNRRYYLDEFMRIGKEYPKYLQEFHGIHNDSFFSAILVKLSDDGEAVKAFLLLS